MPQVEQSNVPRTIGRATDPEELEPFKLVLKIPTFMNRKTGTVQGLEFDINNRFGASIKGLFERKLSARVPLTDSDQKLLAGAITNYKELLAAIFMTASLPAKTTKPAKPGKQIEENADEPDGDDVVTVVARFPCGAR
jgi:hypothetical protein